MKITLTALNKVFPLNKAEDIVPRVAARHSVDNRRQSLERRDESAKLSSDADIPEPFKNEHCTTSELLARVHPHCYLMGMGHTKWLMDDFMSTNLISKRHNSIVLEARYIATQQDVVIKMFNVNNLSPMSARQQEREIQTHSLLIHPNIIKLYTAFKQDEFINMVLEYADQGNLYEYMVQRWSISPMSEEEVRDSIVCPLLNALVYIHSLGIAHRDIKLENILIHRGRVKLADFGVAINLRKERAVTRAGTLNYLSPEVLQCPLKKFPDENKDNYEIGGYTTAVDIWSFGVMIYECLCNASPYATDSSEETKRLIAKGSLPVFTTPASDDAIDFVYKCLSLDPIERPTAVELLTHPWFSKSLGRQSPTNSPLPLWRLQKVAAPPIQRKRSAPTTCA